VRVFEDFSRWCAYRRSPDFNGGSVGFVPTMGALHEGHLQLVKRSLSENQKTVVSIFVNPTQFNNPKDLEKYPRTLQADREKLESVGTDYLIYPTAEQMYPDHFRYSVDEKEQSLGLCGGTRPGHFKGVLTVVMKLFNGVDADRAYFGEKDYQQMCLVQGMTQAFFMKTKVVACPTVREKDGLAMSSRNARLTPEQREIAPLLFRELSSTDKNLQLIRERLENAGFKIDYLEEHEGRRFVAAFLGDVRIIDNV
jgi:pantoate--beta-alanine ligase